VIDRDRRDVARDHFRKSIGMRKSKSKADVIDDICGCSALSSIIHRKDLNSTSGEIANILLYKLFLFFFKCQVGFQVTGVSPFIKYTIDFYGVYVIGC
jgi:hypothetical protein